MTDTRLPRRKKAAPVAAVELPQVPSAEELRRQAEERVAALSDADAAPAAPASEAHAAAVHELRVHEIELEMQNEELRRAQLELEEQRAKYFELFHLAPVGSFTLIDNGIVGEANYTAALMLGVDRQQVVGQPFSVFVFTDDRRDYYRLLQLLKQAEEPQSCVLRLKPLGGEPFWAHLAWRPQRAAGDEPRRYHLTFTDVDERVRAEKALREREEQLDRAVEGSGVGLWDWQAQTGEAVFNERWAEILGYSLAELAPTSIETWRSLTHPDDLRRSDELLEAHFSGRSETYECEARMRHKDGHWVWVLDRGKVSEWGNDGRPLRMIGTYLDVTERKQAEEALRESEEKFRTVADFTYDWEAWRGPDGAYRYVSPSCERISGHAAAELIADPNLLVQITHPEDREKLMAHFDATACESEDQNLELEFRIFTPSGETRWISHLCTAVFGDDGQWLGRRESNRDITERRQAEEALRESEERHKEMISGISDVIAIMSADGTLRYKSPNIEQHFGWLPEDLVGTIGWETVHPDDLERMQGAFLALLSEDDSVATVEYRYKCKDGGYKMIELTATNRVHSPLINGVLMNYHDITARAVAEEQIRQRNQDLARLNEELAAEAAALAAANATITRIAATDDLTGLANRRYFYATLERAVSLARRHGTPMALVSLDLDGLKGVNDTAGHEAGDEMLASFAALLVDLCRAEDLPARLGGDEFSVLLPGIDQRGAQGFAERVLEAVRACKVLAQRRVTVSGGVVQWMPSERPDDCLRRADEALYAAKRLGGDAVTGDR